MANLYFDSSMLEVVCESSQMKNLEKCRYNISKHNCLYSNFLLNNYKSQSFPIFIDYYSFMGNLHFSCSMLEVICESRQMKNLEKRRYNISKYNCLYSNFFLKNYEKSEFSNNLWLL